MVYIVGKKYVEQSISFNSTDCTESKSNKNERMIAK